MQLFLHIIGFSYVIYGSWRVVSNLNLRRVLAEKPVFITVCKLQSIFSFGNLYEDFID